MSDNRYQRSTAQRVLAAELREADYHFKEEDDEYAPNYLLLPSGGKANRVLIGGTLTSVEDRGQSGSSFWKARVNDGTGDFLVFAGQYQPDAANTLRDIANSGDKPPAFVLMYGKTKEFRPEDDEGEVIVNVRPEHVAVVDKQARNRWLHDSAEDTLERLESQEGEYVRQAEDRYGNRAQMLRDDVVAALEKVETSP